MFVKRMDCVGLWEVEAAERDPLRGDLGLVLKSRAKHSAISAELDKPFVFAKRPLVVQYEVLHQNGQECGGAYLKLLSVDKQSADLRKLHDKTPYTIMFGPDKCGNDYKVTNHKLLTGSCWDFMVFRGCGVTLLGCAMFCFI